MEQLTPQNIGCALVICVVLFYSIRGFLAWSDRVDNEWAERNPPDQDEIAAEHVAKRMPAFNRKEYEDATQSHDWECSPAGIQNNPGYVPRGIENSEEARRMNAAYGERDKP